MLQHGFIVTEKKRTTDVLQNPQSAVLLSSSDVDLSCGFLEVAFSGYLHLSWKPALGVLRNVCVPGQRVGVTVLWRACLSEQRSQGWALSLSACSGAAWALLLPCPRVYTEERPFLEERPLAPGPQAPVYTSVRVCSQGPIPRAPFSPWAPCCASLRTLF